MREKFFALLGIEQGEESIVSVLLTQSVFLGIFFGAFDISAHSLFLSVFDEKMMARAYVVSGLAGIILTSLYTFLQTKLTFRNFSIFNLFAVTGLTLMLWITLQLSSAKWVAFLVFIMLGPLNILAALGFWGTVGRLFSLRQGKRLFGLVDSGLIVGIILSCYTIPVILSFNFKPGHILFICAASVFAASLVQILIGSKFSLETGEKRTSKKENEKKESLLKVLSKDRYTMVMAAFVALSVVTAFFVQYSFMAVTREQYPSEEDMARFLGIFTGSMMIFTLLVKLTVFSYIIRNYGLKMCLSLSPLLIAFFTILAIIIGSSMGYTPESMSGFLIFFLVLALSRLFSKSLKDSIESPSFKVIYQTIDEKIRYEVQSGMDGTVNEIAALSSGLILAGLGMIEFVRLIHFSYVLFFIIIMWISISFLLYSEYRKSIRKALEKSSPEPIASPGKTGKSRFLDSMRIRNNYFSLVSGSFSIESGSKEDLKNVIEFASANRDVNLVPALRKIAGELSLDSEIRSRSESLLNEIDGNHSNGRIANARKLLAGNTLPQSTEILRLLRDNSVDSKRFGLYLIGRFGIREMLNEVCECLNVPPLKTDAASVISSFNGEAAPELIRYCSANPDNVETGALALRLLGKIRSKESSSYLFSRLWSGYRIIREIAVKGLLETGFRPSAEEKDKLHQLISDIVGLITWNLAAKICLTRNNNPVLLHEFEKDNGRWRTFLFSLLSIAYDRVSVEKIRENLDKDTVESGNFALEMIDLVVDESVKPKIIALLDTVPDEVKIKNLWHFFPGEVPAYEKLLEDIINRDYNLIDIWTKAYTLRHLQGLSGDTIAESASALLFSPEVVIREEALNLIMRSGNNEYSAVSPRVPGMIRNRLDQIVNGGVPVFDLLFEKNLFLSVRFRNVPEEHLLLLSERMVYAPHLDGNLAEDCIVWPLDDDSDKPLIHYNHDSAAGLPGKMMNAPFYLLSLASVEEFCNQFPDSSPGILSYIENKEE
jgi:ATP/ADP translocase